MAFFGRKVIFTHESGRELIYPNMDMEFTIYFNTDSDGNVGNIRFFNLADETIDILEKKTQFILKAGYANDTGILLPAGIIDKVKTSWNGNEKIVDIIIGDTTKFWLKNTINKTWKVNTQASYIAEDIIDNMPYNAKINVNTNKSYPRGKTFSTKSKKALEELASDTNSKLHITRNTIHIQPPNQGTKEAVVLNKDSGLIGTPQRLSSEKEKKFKVQSLLRYEITTDSVIQINSKSINGKYRVESGQHRLSGNDFNTDCEVMEL